MINFFFLNLEGPYFDYVWLIFCVS